MRRYLDHLGVSVTAAEDAGQYDGNGVVHSPLMFNLSDISPG